MIDRKDVAREKMARAAEMLRTRGIDMWVFYARGGNDRSFALMFGRPARGETLAALTKGGERAVFAPPEELEELRGSGLYSEVTAAPAEMLPELFRRWCAARAPQQIALNISTEDTSCDGLTRGLYARLARALGAEQLQKAAVSGYAMLEELRAVKTPAEIELLREADRITCDIYDATWKRLHTGMNEVQIGALMVEEMRRRGVINALGAPDDPPMILLPKGGMFHRGPDEKNVALPGDVLVIDFSIRWNGYTSDVARTVYFLRPGEEHAPEEVRRMADTAIAAVDKAAAALVPGAHGYEVDAPARAHIRAMGYPDIPHAVGHQVGLEVHDGGTTLSWNKARPSCCGVIRAGEVYALEPTVLQTPDKPSAIIEDDWLVTEHGSTPLSRRQLHIIEIPYREG